MGIFKKAENYFFLGKDSKSLGILGEIKKNSFTLIYSTFLGKKFGKKTLVIRQKATGLLGAKMNYFYLDKEAVKKLRVVCDEALKQL